MKRAAEIIEYLSRPDASHAVLLAPNAPPVTRTFRGVEVALNVVMDAGDIYDTLKALLSMAGHHDEEPVRESGTFSFSMPSVGRFRVHYATQRGSKVARVAVIPYTIPDLAHVCADPEAARQASAVVGSAKSGIIAVTGPDGTCNNALVYALLRELNQSQRFVIYIIERALTFLVAHGESIIIQTELGSDIDTLEKGLANAFMFEPNVVFVGDVRATDSIPSLMHAVGAGMLTIVSSVAITGEHMINQYAPQSLAGGTVSDAFVRCAIRVTPLADGRLAVHVRDLSGEGGRPS
ncbi:MAG: Flp pilus assembly complex ATPase component TadA [Lentisphaerae bacterium]|nr:Flp pilus assembly complex ATPase component TadA [Lentisphaerota bacterium]